MGAQVCTRPERQLDGVARLPVTLRVPCASASLPEPGWGFGQRGVVGGGASPPTALLDGPNRISKGLSFWRCRELEGDQVPWPWGALQSHFLSNTWPLHCIPGVQVGKGSRPRLLRLLASHLSRVGSSRSRESALAKTWKHPPIPLLRNVC